jgi:transaldolase
MNNLLESLKLYSSVVADTGDIDSIAKFKPEDSTTNPSLILNAAKMPQYSSLVKEAIFLAKQSKEGDWIDDAIDHLSVKFGLELLKHVPGRVSTEVDAAFSFDTSATIQKARKLIALYENEGVPKERVLIKIAATWEGIKAAEQLEKEGIQCNLTLIFSLAQAIACANAGVYLISPFVGRILDWYVTNTGKSYSALEDPGVKSVKEIYNYFKKHGHETIVMAASFRNKEEIVELAGCDRLTISPNLLNQLSVSEGDLSPRLSPQSSIKTDIPYQEINESRFRWLMNEDAMATEKLAEGIRKFNADLHELRTFFHEINHSY